MSWGESPTAYRLVKRTARKEHRCCECRGVIKKGERYNYHSGVWEGDPQAFKVCVDCEGLRDRVMKDCELFPEEAPAFTCLGHDLEFDHMDCFREIQRKRNSDSRGFLDWLAEMAMNPAADQKKGSE